MKKSKRRKKKDLGCKLFWGIYRFGITIDRERERGGRCAKKNKKVKNFRQQKSKSKRN